MVEKLAGQGINVVMVALEEPMLHDAHKELVARFPGVQFRKVGVDLSKSDSREYMDPIIEGTKDIKVSLLFNNAGFITTGFFALTAIGRSIANFNCNAACVVPITHHFVKKMMEEKTKGFLAFTSSSAGGCRRGDAWRIARARALIHALSPHRLCPEPAQHPLPKHKVLPHPLCNLAGRRGPQLWH
jgi:short-subunit dehydrogenase